MASKHVGQPVQQLFSHVARARAHAVAHFDYNLPTSRVALYPLQDRSQSKMLVASGRHGHVLHHRFADLPSLLPQNSMLVMNSSRVIPSRVHMRKKHTHGRAELMLLSPSSNSDPAIAMSRDVDGQVWKAYIGGRRIRTGDVLERRIDEGLSNAEPLWLNATITEREGQNAYVKLVLSGETTDNRTPSLAAVLELAGTVPLPPYIKRDVEMSDREAYQTVYAREEGSVAAPTAGLHMTKDMLETCHARGIKIEHVVLHVGAGTFAPLESENVSEHVMHDEQISISVESLGNIANHLYKDRPIVAVGTTSVRTLESMYWFGVRLLTKEITGSNRQFFINQWEPYEILDEIGTEGLPTPQEAMRAALRWNGKRNDRISGRTQLLIVPGYPFKVSTLLMLVSAFQGGEPEDLMRIYREAMENEYRFLSYGDSSLYAPAGFLGS